MRALRSSGRGVLAGRAALAGALALCAAILAAPAAVSAEPQQPGIAARDLSAQQRRPRITVTPRRTVLGPHSVRQCRAWLAQEARPSGTVIVPRQQCWWE